MWRPLVGPQKCRASLLATLPLSKHRHYGLNMRLLAGHASEFRTSAIRTRFAGECRSMCWPAPSRSITSRADWLRRRPRRRHRYYSRRRCGRCTPHQETADDRGGERAPRQSGCRRKTTRQPGCDQSAENDTGVHHRDRIFQNALLERVRLIAAGPKPNAVVAPTEKLGRLRAHRLNAQVILQVCPAISGLV